MMLNIQNGVGSGRDVLLPFTRRKKFDFESYFVISTAEMEAVELNIKRFADVSGASLSVKHCSQNVEPWVICFDHCRVLVFHDWRYVSVGVRQPGGRGPSFFLLQSRRVTPGQPPGSKTLHLTGPEALILN